LANEGEPLKDEGLLHGLKVLDLTEHMAGPFCTMILADMGAEVWKLERPGKGDSIRAWGDGSERNAFFRYINRNKKSITLDYKAPEGKALFLKLAQAVPGASVHEVEADHGACVNAPQLFARVLLEACWSVESGRGSTLRTRD